MWYYNVFLCLVLTCATGKTTYEPNCFLDSAEDTGDKLGKCVKTYLCRAIETETRIGDDDDDDDDDELKFHIDPKAECPDLEICCALKKIIEEEPIAVIPKSIGCGYSNHSAIELSKDSAGYAEFAEFPWMVAMLTRRNNISYSYIGGGSIIHPSVVMTTAHTLQKVKSPENIICRAGEYNMENEDEPNKHQDRIVKSVVKHPKFSADYHRNNVALLFLESPFEFENSPNIGVACLEPTLPPSGTTCFSMGWGQDTKNNQKMPVMLKKLKMGLVEASTCQRMYRQTRLGPRYVLDASLTCAGRERDADSCKGDGGSPLVCPIQSDLDKPRYSVVGMVSYGIGCNTGLPGVYVKIPELYTWISDEMNKANFENKFIY